mgnify:CR=1 FL=1
MIRNANSDCINVQFLIKYHSIIIMEGCLAVILDRLGQSLGIHIAKGKDSILATIECIF